MSQLFDSWPDPYEAWFHTPIGEIVKQTELDLIIQLLQPQSGEQILDAGCGSGIFSQPVTEQGANITGLDISLPMLCKAQHRLPESQFVTGDMLSLPYLDNHFDKTMSITALEFIEDGQTAVNELFRVTKPGGLVVIATLNSLSPWATRRKIEASQDKESVFNHAWFRSPKDLHQLAGSEGITRTAVHFAKDSPPEQARLIEQKGLEDNLNTGAFVIGAWVKQ